MYFYSGPENACGNNWGVEMCALFLNTGDKWSQIEPPGYEVTAAVMEE